MKPSQAWGTYVGCTTPAEFMSNALDLSVKDAVHDYVLDLPNIFPEFYDCLTNVERKKQSAEIEKMLIAYINQTL